MPSPRRRATDRIPWRTSWSGTSSVLITLGTFLGAALLIAARRPDQIRFPEAWNEDGAFIVRFLIEDGWKSIFVPVNGYLIVPSKLVSYLAVRVSFLHYPAVSTFFGIAAQAACVTIVARAPTLLPLRLAAAAAIVAVPTAPEVFTLPEYTLWWTSLLLFVALLWASSPASPWRYLLLIVGGISSPTVVATLPAFALNAAARRRKHDILIFIVAAALAALQMHYVLDTDTASTRTFHAGLVPMIVAKFFGLLIWTGPGQVITGLSLLAGIAAGSFALPKEDRLPYCLLGACLIGTIASAAYRAPVEILNTISGGPRYFFFPFVMQMWMLLWLSARIASPLNALPAIALLMVVPLSYAHFQSHQERLTSWTENALACSTGGDTTFQVHHDGLRQHAHLVPYTHTNCRNAVRHAFADRPFLSRRFARPVGAAPTTGG